ncbi:hypothetical protein M3223_13405 [Paenibacillus pasadenensis]|uniref:hypothetical protein n=1 Tax=Paenibacillus pasadenensis TaxID=217090 RepID=UPI00203D0010|nr:hypothetical protein [Paenibacillus pasadenensis]MCM3748347.1 hypothetical protein [Paenibacillus pasadenensis]
MELEEVFMNEYLSKAIKITYRDQLRVIGIYEDYDYYNNVLEISLLDDYPITRRLFIPMTAIKMIEPYDL